MFDELGGLDSLVGGRSVAVKVNLTGREGAWYLGRPPGQTYRVHHHVAEALAHLLRQAGARRVSFLDGPVSPLPLREFVGLDGWDLGALDALGVPVAFQNTRNLGSTTAYVQRLVPGGGRLFPSYWIHRAYVDCDVCISLAKLKNHTTAGVTLTSKNLFGVTPIALYGGTVPDEDRVAPRRVLHFPDVPPPAGLPALVAAARGLGEDQRVARHIIDALLVRPIDLAIVDGISTIAGGVGPWSPGGRFLRPGLLVAGRNPVCTDAVATACMGYDPVSPDASGPFPGLNHLRLAAAAGVGCIDLEQIETRGIAVDEALHPFEWMPTKHLAPYGDDTA